MERPALAEPRRAAAPRIACSRQRVAAPRALPADPGHSGPTFAAGRKPLRCTRKPTPDRCPGDSGGRSFAGRRAEASAAARGRRRRRPAVRLVHGAAGTETAYGDPRDAALAWQRDGAEWVHLVDLDAAFGRGSNARCWPRWSASSTSESSCPAASGTTTRWPPRWPPAPPGSTSAPPRWSARVVRPGHRRARRPDRRRAGRAAAARWPPAAGPATAATSGRRWPGWTPGLRPLRGHRHPPGRHADRPQPRPLREVCARTDRAGRGQRRVSSLDDLRALAGLGPLGVGGRDRRQGPLRRRLHPARGAGCRGGCRIVGAPDIVAVSPGAAVSGDVVVDGVVPTPAPPRDPPPGHDHHGSSAGSPTCAAPGYNVTDIRPGTTAPTASDRRRPADHPPRQLPPSQPARCERGRRGPVGGASVSPSGSSRAWTSTRAGWSRASTSSTCATPATRSSWPRVYDAEGADELTFLDVTASRGDRETTYDVVRRTAEQVFIPLTVGGGVRTVDDVDRLLRAGADKVGVNTAAIARPELIARDRRPVRLAGAGAVARRAPRAGGHATDAGFEVTTHGGAPRHRHRRGRVGGAGAPSSARARSCSTRWTPTAPRPASTWS